MRYALAPFQVSYELSASGPVSGPGLMLVTLAPCCYFSCRPSTIPSNPSSCRPWTSHPVHAVLRHRIVLFHPVLDIVSWTCRSCPFCPAQTPLERRQAEREDESEIRSGAREILSFFRILAKVSGVSPIRLRCPIHFVTDGGRFFLEQIAVMNPTALWMSLGSKARMAVLPRCGLSLRIRRAGEIVFRT